MAGKPTNNFRADVRSGKLTYFQIFMRPETKERLKIAAKAAGISQSLYAARLLESSLDYQVSTSTTEK